MDLDRKLTIPTKTIATETIPMFLTSTIIGNNDNYENGCLSILYEQEHIRCG